MGYSKTKIGLYVSTVFGLACFVASFALLMPVRVESQPVGQDQLSTSCIDGATAIGESPAADGEPVLRTDPVDPRRLVAAWTTKYIPAGAGADSPITDSIALAQRDTNGRWKKRIIARSSISEVYFDPWLDISPSGIAYLSYLDFTTATQITMGTHLRQVIPGNPPGPDIKPPLTADHTAVAVDQRSFTGGDRLYVVGTNVLVNPQIGALIESRDSGQTWTPEVSFPTNPVAPATHLGPVVATGGSQVMMSWADLGARETIRVAVYDENSGLFTSETEISQIYDGVDFTGSITEDFGAKAIPSLTIARTGAHTGTAYVAWAERTGGPLSEPDIYISSSKDGTNWSSPTKVNDDSDPLATTPQFFPSVSTKPDGNAIVAWMDGRDDPTGQSTLIYQAEVRPNGKVGPNRRITKCPSYKESSGQGIYGDYFNFDASQGNVNLIFPQIRVQGGDSDVFYLGP